MVLVPRDGICARTTGNRRVGRAPPSPFRIERDLVELLAGDVVERMGHDPAQRVDLADAVVLHAGAWRQVLLHARRRPRGDAARPHGSSAIARATGPPLYQPRN